MNLRLLRTIGRWVCANAACGRRAWVRAALAGLAVTGVGFTSGAGADPQCAPGWETGPAGNSLRPFPDQTYVFIAEWDPDGSGPVGRSLVFATESGRLFWYDPASGAEGELPPAVNRRQPQTFQIRSGSALPDGRLLVSGGLELPGVTGVVGLAALRPIDGSGATPQWEPMLRTVSSVLGEPAARRYSLLVTSEGRVVIGGRFSLVDGVPARNVAVLGPRGWEALGTGLAGDVTYLSELPNGDIVASGEFLQDGAGINTPNGIARWDGSFWQPLGEGIRSTSTFPASTASPDGSVYAFRPTGTSWVIGRWDGAAWSEVPQWLWGPPSWLSPLSGSTTSLAVLSDGAIAASFGFDTSRAVAIRRDGVWSEFAQTDNPRGVDRLFALRGGAMAAQGSYDWIGGASARCVAFYRPGRGFEPLTRAANGAINAMVSLSGGVVAIGAFSHIEGVQLNGVGFFDGQRWQPVGPGFPVRAPTRPRSLTALAAREDGQVLIGGTLDLGSIVPAPRVVWLDGTSWRNVGPAFDNLSTINAVTWGSDGTIVVAGSLRRPGDTHWHGAWRWDGTAWKPMNSEGLYINTIALSPQGDLYAAIRTSGDGSLSRWTGRVWEAVPGIAAFDGFGIRAIAFTPMGRVVVGGAVRLGVDQADVARWDGTAWTRLAVTVFDIGVVQSVLALDEERVVWGTTGYATLNARVGTASTMGQSTLPGSFTVDRPTDQVGLSGVLGLGLLPDGSILAGGNFVSINGAPAWRVARYRTVCRCGLSDVASPGGGMGPDGELTGDDVVQFVNWFIAGSLRADVARPGQVATPDNALTADDLIVFIARFVQGC